MESGTLRSQLVKVLEDGEGEESALPRYYGVKKKKMFEIFFRMIYSKRYV